MKLEIEYKDGKGEKSKITRYISKLALIKHMAMAWQGYTPSISTFKKGFGIILAYSSYFPTNTNNYFNNPSAYEYDHTEKSHFSNLAGKAIVDYLANKRIQKAMGKYEDWQSLFNMKNYNEENVYIDTDGIGIIIE